MKHPKPMNRMQVAIAAVVVVVLAIPAVTWGVLRLGEKNTYPAFSKYLSEKAQQQYASKSLWTRFKVAKATEKAVQELELTNWGIGITELQDHGESLPYFHYVLDTGAAVLSECSVEDPQASPAGQCRSFSHEQASFYATSGTRREHRSIPLSLYLGSSPRAESAGDTPQRVFLPSASHAGALARGSRRGRQDRVQRLGLSRQKLLQCGVSRQYQGAVFPVSQDVQEERGPEPCLATLGVRRRSPARVA